MRNHVETQEREKIETELVGAHDLILHNDDHNTFDTAIEALIKVCKHTQHQAHQCTLLVHYKGKCSVKKGEFGELLLMKQGLNDYGLEATVE